jgi:ATP-dependent protease HslVU (ClpYQ) peptidase subunit
MTVCIAAACDNGEAIVTATDGLVTVGDVTGESVIAKMQWKGDWQFMYAGIGANFDLVMEEISDFCLDHRDALSRRQIQQTVKEAYQKVRSRLCSFEVLSPFNLTLGGCRR